MNNHTMTSSDHQQQQTHVVSKESLKKLIQQKDDMEKEIGQLIVSLDATPVGRSGALVDSEGFPRSDIDLNAIRTERNRLICLQNDHTNLMLRIEKDMATWHQMTRDEQQQQQTDASAQRQQQQQQQFEQQYEPFVIVNAVAPDSPASRCGLRKGDRICLFGSITKRQVDQNGLAVLGQAVDANLNKAMPVKVVRDDDMGQVHLDLTLTPMRWSGAGNLGCHLLPLTK